MYIKHLIGARRGEVEDLPFELAKDKVLRGDAEDVHKQLNLNLEPMGTAHVKPIASVPQPDVLSTRVDATVTKAETQRRAGLRVSRRT
jgi:hypothetical protein